MTKSTKNGKKTSSCSVHHKTKYASPKTTHNTTRSYHGPANPFNVMAVPTTKKKKSSNKTGKKNSSSERNKNGGCTGKKRKITAKVSKAKLLNSPLPSSASKKKKKKQVKIVWRVPSESTIGLSLETMPWCHFTTEPLFNFPSKINTNTSNRKKTNFPLILEEMIQNTHLISLLNLEL